MAGLALLGGVLLAGSAELNFRVERLPNNPIIHPGLPGVEPERGFHNINGPSLIRVPGWVEQPLGKYYLYFAHHSGTGLHAFEPGPRYLPGVRHTAVWIDREVKRLYVFHSLVGIKNVPEHLHVSSVDLRVPWTEWKFSEPRSLLKPELDWEGANLPVKTSSYGAAREPVHELRDPAIYEEDGRLYLLYSVAGEKGIAIARLHPMAR
jgi:hypothetical protein